MSGVLEAILAELQAIRLAVSSNAAQPNGHIPATPAQPNVPVHQPVQPAAFDPFATVAATPPPADVCRARNTVPDCFDRARPG
jgi:hypothetical protein